MRQVVLHVLCAALLCGATSGLAFADEGKDESGKGRDRYPGDRDKKEWKADKEWRNRKEHKRDKEWKGEKDWKDNRHASYFHRHGYTRLRIPPGHYPPPGECRVWFPDRPPGHQPPPGPCGGPVPHGAWLISHPPELPGHVYVTAYDPHRPRSVLAIGEFEIGSGAFIRIVVGR